MEMVKGYSKNQDFVQYSRSAMKAHRELMMANILSAVLLDIFIENMGKDNAIVCSMRTLEELTGKKRGALSRAIAVLKERKWIQVLKSGNGNTYLINSTAFWSTWANGKDYSLFHATILLSASEQEETMAELKSTNLISLPVVFETDRVVMLQEELPTPDQQDFDLN